MRASTRLGLFAIFFLVLAIAGFVASMLQGEPVGPTMWAPLILSTINSVGSDIARLIEKQSRGDQ